MARAQNIWVVIDPGAPHPFAFTVKHEMESWLSQHVAPETLTIWRCPDGRYKYEAAVPVAALPRDRDECPGSGRTWGSGAGKPICPECHRGPVTLEVRAPVRRNGRWSGQVPAHPRRTALCTRRSSPLPSWRWLPGSS